MNNKLSHISKKSKMIAAVAFILGLTAVGGTVVNAATAADANKGPMASIVEAIAAKFNLNSADVQSVVTEVMETEHSQMEAKREAGFKARLSAAVASGALTEAQADLITQKAAEIKSTMQAEHDSFQNLTKEEMKTKMEAKRAELKAWAQANGISEENLKFLGGGRGFGGRGMGPKPENM